MLYCEYFGVDVDAVWDTVKKDIPELKKIKGTYLITKS